MKYEENELRPEFLAIAGMNFAPGTCSSPRMSMFLSHISQSIVLKDGYSEERIIQTGSEYEFGKATFNIETDKDIKIITIIPLYQQKIDDKYEYKLNPYSLVIFLDQEKQEYGCMELKYYHSTSSNGIGYRYKYNQDILSSFTPGNEIPKNTIIADSPNKKKNGGYGYGVNMNVAFMSHPGTAEDGVCISESACKKLPFHQYEKITVEFGKTHFPLNIYGDEKEYKIFPDLGDLVRPDGVLMALREYNTSFAVGNMSKADVRNYDPILDKMSYLEGPVGRVVDIRVYCADSSSLTINDTMASQALRYLKKNLEYYKSVVDIYYRLQQEWKKLYNENIRLSPELHSLIVEALVFTDNEIRTELSSYTRKNRIIKQYKKRPIDDFRITFIIERELTPTCGFKLTDTVGGKGVICSVLPDEQMPVDSDGNVAEIIMSSLATYSRMNMMRVYEQYFTSSSRDLRKYILNQYGLSEEQIRGLSREDIEDLLIANQQTDMIYSMLMKYYSLISEQKHLFFSSLSGKQHIEHLVDIIRDKIYLFYPTDNQKEIFNIVEDIEKEFGSIMCYGPVTYKNELGEIIVTKESVRIAPVYILLLKQIASDFNAASTAKLSRFGILSDRTESEKNRYPFNLTASTIISESESRLMDSILGVEAIAEIYDRSNNPLSAKALSNNVLTKQFPTNMEIGVDRDKIPLGNSKPHQLMAHITQCIGFTSVYIPEDLE